MSFRILIVILVVVIAPITTAFGGQLTLRPTDFASVTLIDTMQTRTDLACFDVASLQDSLDVDLAELRLTYTAVGEDGEAMEIFLAPASIDWMSEIVSLHISEEPTIHEEFGRFQTVVCGTNQSASIDLTAMVRSWVERDIVNRGILIKAIATKAGDFSFIDGHDCEAELVILYSRRLEFEPIQNAGDSRKVK